MAKTTYTILTAQSIGAAAAYNQNGQEVDLTAASSNGLALQITVTTVAAPGASKHIYLKYGFSQDQLDIDDAYSILDTDEQTFDVLLLNNANAEQVYVTPVFPLLADYFYVYTDNTTLNNAVTIDVVAIEQDVFSSGAGGATAANQVTGNASLASIDGKLPALSGGSVPVTVTALIPGTGATSLGKAEDSVAASGDTGVMALVVRRDTAAASAADLDYNSLNVDAFGKLWSRSEGGAAEGAAAVGNPNRVGFLASDPTSPPTAEAVGDIVTPLTDTQKRTLVRQADLNRSYDNNTSWAESAAVAANTTAAASLSIRTSAGVVLSVEGVINAAAARYIQLHDVNGTPAGAAVPFAVAYVPAGISNFSFDIPRNGYAVTNGCTLIESTTLATYTATGATEVFATAAHRVA